MGNHSTKFILLFSFLIFNTSIFAQNRGNWQGKSGGGDQPAAIIKGQILDATNESPLEFATVTIFSKKDSSMVTGGISEGKGAFQIETKKGFYYAKFEFIGYQERIIDNIEFDKNNVADLGVVALLTDAETLNEIEVRAEKSTMQISLDKKIFNVGKDLANQGGTAENILDNVPSVAVDVEGGITLRGSGSVRILINGKPSGLVGDGNVNGLRSIPANLIDRVEVITNPSARYEAEGMAGIINIVLKKQEGKGLNGSVDLSVGQPHEYGTALNFNYRKKNLNWFSSIGLRYRRGPGQGWTNQRFINGDTAEVTNLTREMERGGLSGNFRFGADYYINPKNILTTSLNYRMSDEDNNTDVIYNDLLEINGVSNHLLTTLRNDDEKEEEMDLEYVLTYRKLFEGKGHELVTDIRFEENEESENSLFTEQYRLLNGEIPRKDSIQRSENVEGTKQLALQIDYVKPFSQDSKFELGFRGSIRQINNDYEVTEQDPDTKIFSEILGLSNNFNYDENIYAVYSQYGNKINRFSYQFGLRAEYTDVTTELINTNEINPRDYLNAFPSVFLGYDLPNENAMQVSYSRRIRRPRFRDLNPFFTFSDNRNFYSGNPNLDPEFTDSYEIAHIKYWEKGSLSSAIYHRHTTGVIQRIRLPNEDGTTFMQPQNLSTQNDFGLEFTYSYNPFKWWRINGDVNFFRSITDGVLVTENKTFILDADTYTMRGRITSKVTVTKNLDVQLTGNYRGPRETTTGRARAMYHFDLGMSKDVLKNNGTLTLSVRDIFNTRKRRYSNEFGNFISDGEFQWRQRQITLSLNYRINKKKERGGMRRGDFDGGMDGF